MRRVHSRSSFRERIKSLKLRQVFQFAARWWWLLVLCIVFASGVSYLISAQLPRVFESTAKLLVTPGQAATNGSSYNDVLAAERLTRTHAEVLKTPPIVETAARNAGLDISYEDAVKLLDVHPLRDTQLIQISSQAHDPEVAARFTNEIAAAFIQQTESGQSKRYRGSMDNLAAQVDQLVAQIAERTRQADVLRGLPSNPARDTELAGLQSELAQLQQSSAAAVRSYEEIRLAEARGTDQLALVQPATAATTSLVQPRTTLNVLLAALAGLIVALAAAITVEYLDDRLRTPERVMRFTGLHALGLVAMLPKGGPHTVDLMPHTSTGDGYGGAGAVEAYRLLRTNLRFASVAQSLKTLLVTSSEMAEGKTTTAANLAIVLAQAGQRVLLVDADLRRPTQHTVFGVPNRVGLTSLLIDETLDVRSAILETRVPGLSLIPSGLLPPNPSELLASQRMRDRFGELTQNIDILIVDSPPVLAVSDPAALAGLVDGVLLVVHAQRTHGQRSSQAVAILQGAGAHLLGAVLNATPPSRGTYYASPQAYETRPSPTSA